MSSVVTGRHRLQSRLRHDEFWAVRDVSFQLRRGECLGLIGHNGAGKTTLLRILNGLITPDSGSIRMRGKVAALIALGAGFNPILTGRENVYANGAVLGMSRREIDSKFDDIVEFADVAEFIDAPVQTYSSGMQVRLGFAVATCIDPDVLIIDEVLAVGDSAFQSKCFKRIGQLVAQNCCIIFVSHQLYHVSRICTKALLMAHGEVAHYGNVSEAIRAYRSVAPKPEPATGAFTNNRQAEVAILAVTVTSGGSGPVKSLASGSATTFTIEYDCVRDIPDVVLTLSLTSDFDGTFTHYSTKETKPLSLKAGRGRVSLQVPFLGLSAGQWRIAAGIFDATGVSPYAWNWTAADLVVTESAPMVGRFRFAHSWDFCEHNQVISPAGTVAAINQEGR